MASYNNSKRTDNEDKNEILQQAETEIIGEELQQTVTNIKQHNTATDIKKDVSIDYDKLWYTIFEEGESRKGSFNLLRLGAVLKRIDDNSFTVEASNETILYYVKENAPELEALMEKHVGKKLRLECCMADDGKQQEKKKTAEELADEIENKFGIQIDVL